MARNFSKIDPKKFFENIVELLDKVPMVKDSQSIGVIEDFEMPDIKEVTIKFSIFDENNLLQEAIEKSKTQR